MHAPLWTPRWFQKWFHHLTRPRGKRIDRRGPYSGKLCGICGVGASVITEKTDASTVSVGTGIGIMSQECQKCDFKMVRCTLCCFGIPGFEEEYDKHICKNDLPPPDIAA